MAQKRTKHIPEGSNALVEKFVNYVMKDGKKNVARQIFKDTLQIISQKGDKNPEKVFEKAIQNVKPDLEVKAKRIGGAVYQIPMEVKPNRQVMLAFRWILAAARGRKGSPIANKLAQELIEAASEQGAAIKKKEDTHRMAHANKAFAHYARY